MTISAVHTSHPPVPEAQIDGVWHPEDDETIETYGFVENTEVESANGAYSLGGRPYEMITMSLADRRTPVLRPMTRHAQGSSDFDQWYFSVMELHRWHRVTIGNIFDVRSRSAGWNLLFTATDRVYVESLSIVSMCSKNGRCETYDKAFAAWRRVQNLRDKDDADKWRTGVAGTN